MEKFARKCDVSGKGMNEGYCFNEGETYCATEVEAKKHVEEIGLNWEEELETIETEDEWFFWTDWEIEEGENFYDEEGNEYTICHKCEKETIVNEDSNFCTHCLTHL